MRARGPSGPPTMVEKAGRLVSQARRYAQEGGRADVMRRALEKVAVYAEYQLLRVRRPRTFTFDGEVYRYLAHPYNATWRCERAVEIPLARRFLSGTTGVGLELGNVMRHYGPISHAVIDKYEGAPHVIAKDIVDYEPDHGFDYILSVSTLEHVGWDESPRDPDKACLALSRLRALLTPGGRLFVTCPSGYNPGLDTLIFESSDRPTREGFLRRELHRNSFWQIDKEEARVLSLPRRECFVLWVAEFGSVGH